MALAAKNNAAVETEGVANPPFLHNAIPWTPSHLLESLGYSDGLVSMQNNSTATSTKAQHVA